jgi:hypothetical protein
MQKRKNSAFINKEARPVVGLFLLEWATMLHWLKVLMLARVANIKMERF